MRMTICLYKCLKMKKTRWWFQIFFICKLGEMIQFDEHIFQIGLVQPTISEVSRALFAAFFCRETSQLEVLSTKNTIGFEDFKP